MSRKLVETKAVEGPYHEGLGDDWEPKDDLAASIADHQRFKEERRIAAARRRRRFRLTALLLSIVLIAVGLLMTRSYMLRRKEDQRKGDQRQLRIDRVALYQRLERARRRLGLTTVQEAVASG